MHYETILVQVSAGYAAAKLEELVYMVASVGDKYAKEMFDLVDEFATKDLITLAKKLEKVFEVVTMAHSIEDIASAMGVLAYKERCSDIHILKAVDWASEPESKEENLAHATVALAEFSEEPAQELAHVGYIQDAVYHCAGAPWPKTGGPYQVYANFSKPQTLQTELEALRAPVISAAALMAGDFFDPVIKTGIPD